MVLRRTKKMHYPCAKCGTMFERYGKCTLCDPCFHKALAMNRKNNGRKKSYIKRIEYFKSGEVMNVTVSRSMKSKKDTQEFVRALEKK